MHVLSICAALCYYIILHTVCTVLNLNVPKGSIVWGESLVLPQTKGWKLIVGGGGKKGRRDEIHRTLQVKNFKQYKPLGCITAVSQHPGFYPVNRTAPQHAQM